VGPRLVGDGQNASWIDMHVETDGQGLLFVWVADLRGAFVEGWLRGSRGIDLELVVPALNRLAHRHDDDADIDNYDWALHTPRSTSAEAVLPAGANESTQPRSLNGSTSSIYVLESDGYFKIGVTARHPRDRIRDMSTGNPHPIVLVAMFEGDARAEQLLHTRFRNQRRRGEWFDLREDLAAVGGDWEQLLGLEARGEPSTSTLFDLEDPLV
jgi:hypothetical protein